MGAGNTLGNKNQVRVFPIDKVKGMEFDMVFFIDINNTDWDDEIIKRYLYVGVSRAAFFLGVTLTEDVPALTKYFKVGQDWKDISRQDSNN
ncbi:MAG: ATP-binding domain-containing protein [Paludibacteraceae bacterium]|nr:ATP-binding domain-containing protein [Paludibacteraceae bacterium]